MKKKKKKKKQPNNDKQISNPTPPIHFADNKNP